MCCLFTSLVLLGPRFVGVLWWLFKPVYWQAAFTSMLWPILGLVFVPWTTLMYLILYPGGIVGFEWAWLVLAVVMDIASWSGGAYGNRERIPGYSA